MRAEGEQTRELLLARERAVDEAVRRAVADALADHKRAGNPIASWKDGRVVLLPASQIPVGKSAVKVK